MKNHFLRQSAYNHWANQQVLNKLVQHLDQRESIGKLSHVVLAEAVWLSRIIGSPKRMDIFQVLPLTEIQQLITANKSGWDRAIEEAELTGFFHLLQYQSIKGEPFTNSLSDIITHVFNHGTYHRAQIATLLRQNQIDPVVTDFIAFARLT